MEFIAIDFGRDFLWLTLLCNALLSLVRCRFLTALCGVRKRAAYYIAYTGLSLVCMAGVFRFPVPEALTGVFFFCMTLLFVRYGMGRRGAVPLLAVMLIYVVEQAASGMLSPLYRFFVGGGGEIAGIRTMIAASFLLETGFIALLYRGIAWKAKLTAAEIDRYFWIILMPVLMLFLFYSLSFEAGMWDMVSVLDPKSGHVSFYYDTTALKEVLLFLSSAAAYSSVLFILLAYQKITLAIHREQESFLLRQQLKAQKAYLCEAREKMEQTRSLRHDFQNHLSVVGGLLSGGRAQEASLYLAKLKAVSDSLAFPYNTGSHTLDALLEEKLAAAARLNIKVDCQVSAPREGQADDFDLCIVFANALDNAVEACRQVGEEKRFLRMSTKISGSLYQIEMENSCKEEGTKEVTEGTGLLNMRAVAGKYNGALSAEKRDGLFILDVLMILSEQS